MKLNNNSSLNKFISLLLILFIWQIGFSQEKKISIRFENNTLKEAFLKIEAKTNTFFYFQENWLDDTTITKSYQDVSIKNLLEDLLKDTSLNFYIHHQKVIITKNNFIKEKLPLHYFDSKKEAITNDNSPIFIKEYMSNSKIKDNAIISIGKESNTKQKSLYKVFGYIKSKATNKPIKDLIIRVENTNIYATTNSKGYYSLKIPPGIHTISTKYTSYQDTKKDIVVYGDGNLSFKVKNAAVNLNEVLINSGKNSNIKKAAIGITKIDIKGIKTVPLIFGERDILKVATTMPGIKTAGEGSLGYNVRGGKSDQNLIKLDNAVIYNPSHFFGVFSAINPFSSGDVAIYKGNVPAEFGGRLSSVIDISTKSINKEKFKGQGNIGLITANLMLETPIVKNKTAVLTGFRTTYSNWILKKVPDENIKNSEASFFDGILRFETKINKKSSLKATGYYSKDKFSISSDSLYKYSNRLASIDYNYSINEKNKLNLQLNNTRYEFSIINDGITNQNFDFNFAVNETQLKLKLKYLRSKMHRFNYGLSSKLYNLNPGNLTPLDEESIIEPKFIAKEKALESAVFIEDNIKLNEKLQFNVGFRYSFYAFLGEATQHRYAPDLPVNEENIVETIHYKKNEIVKTYGTPEVRISASFAITPELSIKGGYNNGAQYIHTLSNNTTASPVDTWKLSNLNIKPQKSNQFSLGIFKNFQDGNYKVSLESYYKKLKNMLDFKIGAELTLNENIETELLSGQGKAYGIELLIQKKKGRFNGWIGYSYSRSFLKLESKFLTNQVNNGEYFPTNFDKPHDFSLIANYRLTKRYSFSANFIYQTGRPITYPIGKFEFAGIEHVLYSDRNKFRIPDYYRLDLGINIEGNHKIKKLAHSFWNISVYNVLGRNNPYSVFFVNEDGKIQAYQTSIFSIPVPTVSYNFKF